MTKLNRKVDVYPYERSNAEKIVEKAKKFVVEYTELEMLMHSFEKKGKDFSYNNIGFQVVTETFQEDIENLIIETFPELMPINWEALS